MNKYSVFIENLNPKIHRIGDVYQSFCIYGNMGWEIKLPIGPSTFPEGKDFVSCLIESRNTMAPGIHRINEFILGIVSEAPETLKLSGLPDNPYQSEFFRAVDKDPVQYRVGTIDVPFLIHRHTHRRHQTGLPSLNPKKLIVILPREIINMHRLKPGVRHIDPSPIVRCNGMGPEHVGGFALAKQESKGDQEPGPFLPQSIVFRKIF